jgi:hypothetical protein
MCPYVPDDTCIMCYVTHISVSGVQQKRNKTIDTKNILLFLKYERSLRVQLSNVIFISR